MSTAIKVTLYCPSLDKEIKNADIHEPDSYDNIIFYIASLLRNPPQLFVVDYKPQIFIYNTRREPITDFTTVTNSQTLLVATSYFELPLSPTNKDILIVQPGPAKRAWAALSRAQKRKYITTLMDSPPPSSPEKTYLTMSRADVMASLDSILSPESSKAGSILHLSTSTMDTHLTTIKENWDMDINACLGFQGLVRPYGPLESWKSKFIPVMALLSDATVGQGKMVSKLVIDAVFARGGPTVVQVGDLVKVGRELYDGVI
ncbi:Nn.00g048100.m01.CDS01 [Neocucurbitaria sp. VM-36]